MTSALDSELSRRLCLAFFAASLYSPTIAFAQECWTVSNMKGYSAFANENYKFSQDGLRSNLVMCFSSAVVNYAKHRGLPDPALQLEPDDHPAPYAMQFESFGYGGDVRPRVEVERLLSPAYVAVNRAVVRTGNAVNKCLAMANALAGEHR